MTTFHNPYHFVPADRTEPGNSASRDSFFGDRNSSATHERYVPGTYSGRLVIRLTTVTPLVVGNKQNRPRRDDYATVEPYLIDQTPAIPGSSLRGMIGSIIEAATNAPLRVLRDQPYSYRKTMETSLSAIGLIVEEQGELKLRPMCLPTLESKDSGRSFEAPTRFRKIFPQPQFKVFFGDARSIRDSSFPYRTHLANAPLVPMPVKQLTWSGNKVMADRSLHIKGGRYLVAQDADRRDPGRQGRVRVLGCWPQARNRDIPSTKKHELWLPEPAADAPTLPISKTAIDRFNTLASERTEEREDLPFEPLDTRTGESRKSGLRLRAGDMVYFDVDSQGKEVMEFSFSAIWRGRVEDPATHEPATAWKFFAAIDSELLPANPKRTTISTAEQLLGFVDEVTDQSSRAFALASRLRVFDALPQSNVSADLLLPPVTLKILGSPKPPCPVLYFKPKNAAAGGYVEKRALNPAEHAPQGRKWYLHSKPKAGSAPWASSNPRDENTKGQKSIVRPIKAGTSFCFHIDFDNLSYDELGLLIFALEPSNAFHHKLGMGKPLGLGTVKLDILGYFPIDRINRYSVKGFQSSRYSEAALTPLGKQLRDEKDIPAWYKDEFNVTSAAGDFFTDIKQHLDQTGLIRPEIKRALLLLGDYERAPEASDVRYPTTADQLDKESELFKWFVFNDGHRERGRGMTPTRQFLKPLNGERRVPRLVELEWRS